MAAIAEAKAAIAAGDAALLNRLLDADSELANSSVENGASLLMHSLYAGQRTLAEAIAKRKSSVDAFELTALGRTDDVLAAITEDESLLSAKSKDGFTLLHLACFFGSDDGVKMLLEQGAEPNVATENEMKVMPLHSAIAAGRRHAVNMLILAGADVNARQQAGFTPLHGAANRGDLDMIKALLDAGADPFTRSETGETALEIAKRVGKPDAGLRIEQAMRKSRDSR